MLESVHHKKPICLELVQIVLPSLKRTSDFLAGNSPSLSMLKFMDIVLSDIQILFHERRQKQPAQQATVMSNLTETEQQF